MPDNIRYSVDDTILDDPIIRKGIKIKGVTQFNRQENIKNLISQHLSKEDKKLKLETFTDNGLKTFRVLLNELEIGVLPQDSLSMFLSNKYDYSLTNIHLGEMTVEEGKIIYFAKLYVTFTPNSMVTSTQSKYKICPVCGKENDSTAFYCYHCKINLNIDISTRQKILNELQSLSLNLDKTNADNQRLKKELGKHETEINIFKSKLRSTKTTPTIIAVVAFIIAVITVIVSHSIIEIKDEKYNSLKEDYELMSDRKEYISIDKYSQTIDKGNIFTLTFRADTLFDDYIPEYNFTLFDSNYKIEEINLDYEAKKTPDKKFNKISIEIPKEINNGNHYIEITTSGYSLFLPFKIQ